MVNYQNIRDLGISDFYLSVVGLLLCAVLGLFSFNPTYKRRFLFSNSRYHK